MGRSEALELFREWLSSSTLLRCQVSFRGLAVGTLGRLLDVSNDGVRLRSEDGVSEIQVSFSKDTDVDFGLGNGPESSEHGRGVVVLFTLPPRGSRRLC